MDRQAWIAVTLCVLGLVGWQIYSVSHAPPRVPVTVSPTPTPQDSSIAAASPAPGLSPTPAATAAPPPVESTPAFAEKSETLR
ncbi:MAG: hypothetical protein WAO00_06555, partial [Chthoniobacterales bacterium]